MARRYKFCVNCRRTISDTEMRRGLYVECPDGLLCATCTRRLDEMPEAESETVAPVIPKPVAPKPLAPKPVAPTPAPPPTVEKKTEPPPPPPAPSAGKKEFAEMREILESIHRTLLFEKTSSWNIVGAIAQCMAIGMLLIAAMQWLDGGEAVFNTLLVAIVFQLMALTFFVKAK